MPLEKSASYWADLVHADHPHKPLPANTGQQKGTLTKRQRGSRLDAKNTPQGVIIASEFTLVHADHRTIRIMRPVIDLQHIFHGSHEGGAGVRRNDELLLQVRFEKVFFSVRPIV